MAVGKNQFKRNRKDIIFEVQEIETIFSGLCYGILPFNVSSKPGERYIFKLDTKIATTKDQVSKINLQFSSKDSYLDIVWKGLPGIETVHHEMKLDEYENMIVFYKEIRNLYIKNCDEGNQTVFQNFAKSFTKNIQKYNCTNVCVPIYLEPILRTIEHDIEYCKNSKDYYCMYEVALQEIAPLAPETLKSCEVKSPKIFDIKNPNHNRINLEDLIRQIIKDIENESIEERKPTEHTFHLIVEMSGDIIINQEYLVYDTLSLIGTIGGTLGLFLGFSFYDFVIMFIDFFAARCEKYRPASVNSIGQGLREGMGIGTMVLSATNQEENLNGINLNHGPKNGSI